MPKKETALQESSQTQPLTGEDIDFVSKLTEEAGHLALSMRDRLEISEKTSPEDQVTSADLAISRLFKERLQSRFRDDAVISEEDLDHALNHERKRIWLIDPIDGTQNYIMDHDDYCIMVGLLIDLEPCFGWVLAPQSGRLYYGGKGFGVKRRQTDCHPHAMQGKAGALPLGETLLEEPPPLPLNSSARVVMGTRDRRSNPWVKDLEKVDLVKTGSIGLKVALILEGEADVFAHLSGKLKTWDTAGPAALALGAGLDVGGLELDSLDFPLPETKQECTVIMGRKGALAWCRKHLQGPQSND